jgi:hypothetical protein
MKRETVKAHVKGNIVVSLGEAGFTVELPVSCLTAIRTSANVSGDSILKAMRRAIAHFWASECVLDRARWEAALFRLAGVASLNGCLFTPMQREVRKVKMASDYGYFAGDY